MSQTSQKLSAVEKAGYSAADAAANFVFMTMILFQANFYTDVMGLAASANLDPLRRFPSMFEPIHGSAFDITGQGIANPVASFWTAAQMLDHLGEADASARLMRAVEKVTGAGIVTPDVGGTATTKDVTNAVVEAIQSSNV